MTNPDVGIQTNTVQRTSLPYLDSSNRYLVRYRIRTADGNLSTAWSTVHRITKPSIADLTYTVEKEIKSHGKSFDVSWNIISNDTQLAETPEQIKDLPLDAYVRWGGKITSVTGPVDNVYTITVDYPHNFFVGQNITVEQVVDGVPVEDNQATYNVTGIVDQDTFTITESSPSFIEVGSRLWSRWEFVATTTANSFSVPIPEHHQSTISHDGYAEFMVHLATFQKDRNEITPETMIFYSESFSTRAKYDAGSIV